MQALSKAARMSGRIGTVATIILCITIGLVALIFGAIVGAVVAIVGIENQRRFEENSK